MTQQRRIIAYLAISADGYIARRNGDVEWLNRRPDDIDYGMSEFYSEVDTILLGRKTYDWALDYSKKMGKSEGLFDTTRTHYVFSTNQPPETPLAGMTFVSEPIKPFVQRLRAAPGKQIWMMGGGGLIGSFLDAGEIDEFDMHVIPVFIGEGIPLIEPRHRDVPLRLIESHQYTDGVVRLRYEVESKGAA
jgi:dihydrofolate reductase